MSLGKFAVTSVGLQRQRAKGNPTSQKKLGQERVGCVAQHDFNRGEEKYLLVKQTNVR